MDPFSESWHNKPRQSSNLFLLERPNISMDSSEEMNNGWLEMDDSFYHKVGDELLVGLNVVVLNLADIDTAHLSYRMRLELWVCWALTKSDVESYMEDPNNWTPTNHPKPAPWTIDIDEMNMMPFLSGRTTQVFIFIIIIFIYIIYIIYIIFIYIYLYGEIKLLHVNVH